MDLQKLSVQYGLSVDEIRQRWLTLRAAKWKSGESGFRLFCKEAIRIRTKTGELAPLVLNEAQEILHRAAEKQLAEEGWVRLAGLKGRREGFCLDPSTRVLTANLEWVAIDDLEEGTEIIACDEAGQGVSGRGFLHRKMRTAVVEFKANTYQDAFRIHFDDGSSVVCSQNHRWLTRTNQDTLEWCSLGHERSRYRLRVGSVIRGVTDTPWDSGSYEDAWFGGILDGEGSFHDRKNDSVSMSAVQNDGAVWWKMRDFVTKNGYEPKFSVDKTIGYRGNMGKQGSNPSYRLELNKMKHIFRCLGLCCPVRFRTRWWEGRKLPTDCARTIVHIEPLPFQRLIDIQTSTGTFIAEGLVSHNSTYVAARGYHRATLWDRQRIYILSHMMDSSDALFDMVDLMQNNHPFPPAVGKDNAKELEFVKRGSTYTVATAGQKAGGRGQSISFFHGSESAWWTNAPDHFASSVQAVDEVKGRWGVIWRKPPNPLPFEATEPDQIEGWIIAPSEIWLETTSAGPTGEFHKRYMDAMKGVGRYRAVFVPWTAELSYSSEGDFIPGQEPEEDGELSEAEYQRVHGLTNGQMLWRREKLHELGSIAKFRQEYPIDVTEAFAADSGPDTFIKPALILRARKRKIPVPDAPLIVGVDPAGTGGDRFAVSWRRGDRHIKTEFRHKLEHDEAVAWLAEIIDTDRPARMCVDRGSMGQNIISSLRAQKKRYAEVVKGIDFGGKSKAKLANPNRAGPWNKRAEMYGKLRDWLTEGGAIVDDDDLASDLAANKIKYRANNDWLLKSKPELKAEGLRSPDLADSLALTFAVEEFFDDWEKPKQVDAYGSWNVSEDFADHELAGSPNGWMM